MRPGRGGNRVPGGRKLRVVADTSSLVRAALNPGSAAGRLIMRLLADSGNSLAISPTILFELVDVLGRSKFAIRLAPNRRQLFLVRLTALTILVEPTERITECRDPSDDMVLEAALESAKRLDDTTIVISDDQDLLSMDPWRGIRIVKPEAALMLVATPQQ